jgi:ABC-type branched-subunit amino acid transport system ATPase component
VTRDGTGLATHRLSAGYGKQPVIHDLELRVVPGQVVALLGPNGAGKTTTVLTVAGVLRPLAGQVTWNGQAWPAGLTSRARRGLGLVTEQRCVFMRLTVAENLALGAGSAARAFELFPELEEHRSRLCGLLSGGQQQMLALARVLASEPKALVVDELSLGLAPLIVQRLLGALRVAADSGVAVLLVEQHLQQALQVADFAYVLDRGRLAMEGTKADLQSRSDDIATAYLAGKSRVTDGISMTGTAVASPGATEKD